MSKILEYLNLYMQNNNKQSVNSFNLIRILYGLLPIIITGNREMTVRKML